MTDQKKHHLESGNLRTDWAIAIFTARETAAVLKRTIQSALNASRHKQIVLDVIVNGNYNLATEICKIVNTQNDSTKTAHMLRIWYIDVKDKSGSWNTYIYKIAPKTEFTFFIDGYVQVNEESFSQLEKGLQNNTGALAATGVPSLGKSANNLRRKMISSGGIHGNLYVLRHSTVQRIRDSGFMLPIGLYRTDAMLAAIICFNFDPKKYTWDVKRIHVEPSASWIIEPLAWWRPDDIVSHVKKIIRQAQGDLENKSYSYYLGTQKLLPKNLPKTSKDLCMQWVKDNTKDSIKLFIRNPVRLITYISLVKQPDIIHIKMLAPMLIGSYK